MLLISRQHAAVTASNSDELRESCLTMSEGRKEVSETTRDETFRPDVGGTEDA